MLSTTVQTCKVQEIFSPYGIMNSVSFTFHWINLDVSVLIAMSNKFIAVILAHEKFVQFIQHSTHSTAIVYESSLAATSLCVFAWLCFVFFSSCYGHRAKYTYIIKFKFYMSQFFDPPQRLGICLWYWTIVVYILWRWIGSEREREENVCVCSCTARVFESVSFNSLHSFIHSSVLTIHVHACDSYFIIINWREKKKTTIKSVVTIFVCMWLTHTKKFMKCCHCPS